MTCLRLLFLQKQEHHPPHPPLTNNCASSQISNYARPGFQSRHNRAYWENVPFLAFGNGAASFVDGNRFSRPRGLPEYGQWVNKLVEEGWAEATGALAAVPAVAGGGEAIVGGGGTRGESEDKEQEEDEKHAAAVALDLVSF